MAKTIRLTAEQEIEKILETYKQAHPKAQTKISRYNSASIRVRIIDPRFAKMSLEERDQEFWKYMEELSDNAYTQITMAILLTRDELTSSFANLEFEHPAESNL